MAKHGRFYANVIGTAPRAIVCGGCKADVEIVLGIYRGMRKCERCGQTAEVIVQGFAVKPPNA